MGGKSYFCDYCRCFMKNDINVRKLHNAGLAHTIAKQTYMRRYEDPRKVLAEEITKTRCVPFLKGFCRFGIYCKNRHFNGKQMKELQNIATKMDEKEIKAKTTKRELPEWKHLLPWHKAATASAKKSKRLARKRLPQSLRPLNFNKISEDCFKTEWG